ncbi:MAG TPA: hypothetical protein VJX16_14270 [Terriglobales bacterium]|nr:hypothetical protein [Terriglobales bacterium]
MRLSFAPALFVATTRAFGQSPFIGMWQTSTSRVTDKPAITVVIVELEKRLGDAVVLVNPDAREIKLPILNLKITENVMEFETHGSGLCFWSLKLQRNRNRGLLHGGCPAEMLIDEPVPKRPPTTQ